MSTSRLCSRAAAGKPLAGTPGLSGCRARERVPGDDRAVGHGRGQGRPTLLGGAQPRSLAWLVAAAVAPTAEARLQHLQQARARSVGCGAPPGAGRPPLPGVLTSALPE